MICMYSQAIQARNVCTSPRSQRNDGLAGKRVKSRKLAEHQAQQHAQVAVPSSDGTTVTTVMMHHRKFKHMQTMKNMGVD